MARYPTNYFTGKRSIKAPKTGVGLNWGAGTSWNPGGVNDYWSDPGMPGADSDYWNPGTWDNGVIGIGAGPDPSLGNAARPGSTSTPTSGGSDRSIQINGAPDYRGILDRYTSDMRARINTGLANMNVARLGNARALVNRLGIRDPNAALEKFGKFGLTLADLQSAADNPFSELKAIQDSANRQRGMGEAGMAARGGFRSGGTSRMYERVEDERARNEAMASEDALRGLAQGQNEVTGWQQQQEDALMNATANYQMQLAQAYQPQTAYWDEGQGGYRWGNTVYDQFGNKIRDL